MIKTGYQEAYFQSKNNQLMYRTACHCQSTLSMQRLSAVSRMYIGRQVIKCGVDMHG